MHKLPFHALINGFADKAVAAGEQKKQLEACLTEHPGQINALDAQQNTPLMLAVKLKLLPAVEGLFELHDKYKCHLDQQPGLITSGYSALIAAVSYEDLGADLEKKGDEKSDSPDQGTVLDAVRKQVSFTIQRKILDFIIARMQPRDFVTYFPGTIIPAPIPAAVKANNQYFISRLLDRFFGTEQSCLDSYNRPIPDFGELASSIFYSAMQEGNPEVLKLYLAKRKSMQDKWVFGNTRYRDERDFLKSSNHSSLDWRNSRMPRQYISCLDLLHENEFYKDFWHATDINCALEAVGKGQSPANIKKLITYYHHKGFKINNVHLAMAINLGLEWIKFLDCHHPQVSGRAYICTNSPFEKAWQYQHSPFENACLRGNFDIVRYFLYERQDPITIIAGDLKLAAERNNIELVKFFVNLLTSSEHKESKNLSNLQNVCTNLGSDQLKLPENRSGHFLMAMKVVLNLKPEEIQKAHLAVLASSQKTVFTRLKSSWSSPSKEQTALACLRKVDMQDAEDFLSLFPQQYRPWLSSWISVQPKPSASASASDETGSTCGDHKQGQAPASPAAISSVGSPASLIHPPAISPEFEEDQPGASPGAPKASSISFADLPLAPSTFKPADKKPSEVVQAPQPLKHRWQEYMSQVAKIQAEIDILMSQLPLADPTKNFNPVLFQQNCVEISKLHEKIADLFKGLGRTCETQPSQPAKSPTSGC